MTILLHHTLNALLCAKSEYEDSSNLLPQGKRLGDVSKRSEDSSVRQNDFKVSHQLDLEKGFPLAQCDTGLRAAKPIIMQ